MRSSGVRTYVFDKDGGGLVDVTDSAREPPRPRVHVRGDSGYEGLRAADGADISSRSKYFRYMRERGLAHASDYGLRPDGTLAEGSAWDKAARRREAFAKDGGDQAEHRRRRERVVSAVKKLEQGYRPAPAPRVDSDPECGGGGYAVVKP
jgi:hypothetical protein